VVLVFGFFQYAAVKVQPGEFPIDEPFGALGEIVERYGDRYSGSSRRGPQGRFFF
jgi:hypothetical protein